MIALDLFRGAGGWSVAAESLGIDELGVEIMPAANATAEANGFVTHRTDVWDDLRPGAELTPAHELQISSPVCKTFSMAGLGAGRRAEVDLIAGITGGAYKSYDELRRLEQMTDPVTALTLIPLAYAYRDKPTYIALEQVPQVLPIWKEYQKVLESWGYSVWTGLLNAEQYGVPQTRKRAILLARRDGRPVAAPIPTHSRYYNRDKERLDPGVLKWVSMAEALGWEVEDILFTNQGNPKLGYQHRAAENPSPTVTSSGSRSWNRGMRSNYTTGHGEGAGERGVRMGEEPAPTITTKVSRNLWITANDKLSNAASRNVEEPSMTITAGHDSANRVWFERPATTVTSRPDVAGPGRSEFVKGGVSRQDRPGTVRVSVREAATLQSFPKDFEFRSYATRQYEMVGNAIPPLLARACLEAVML